MFGDEGVRWVRSNLKREDAVGFTTSVRHTDDAIHYYNDNRF